MTFSFDLILEFLPVFVQGALVTLAATVVGFAFALIVGAVLLTLIQAPSRVVSLPATIFMEFVRSTPLLVQVYFLFFVLPDFGIKMPAFMTGVVALGLHHGAYVSETYRAGLAAVSKGQWDAAVSLNYPRAKAYHYLILPQAVPIVIPALGNTLITMIKDTPILSAITVTELMFVANDIGTQRFQYTEPITFAAVIYLVLSLAAAVGITWLDRSIRKART
jgi:polar amino acid transport system permease protein